MHGAGVKTDPHGAIRAGAPAESPHARPHTRPHAQRRVHAHEAWLIAAAFGCAGNLFEGEWKDGKPITKDGKRVDTQEGGPMEWLNEAVANVSINIGGGPSRGGYGRVSTHDDDDDRR
jgi:hypothetical protein